MADRDDLSFTSLSIGMYGLLLPNPRGLQVDLYLHIFFVWLGIGVCLMVAWYLFVLRRRALQESHLQGKSEKEYDHLEYSLLLTRLQQSDHQQLLTLFVAYVENFTTRGQSYSPKELRQEAGLSPEEILHVQEVWYSEQTLHPDIKTKLLHYVNMHPSHK